MRTLVRKVVSALIAGTLCFTVSVSGAAIYPANIEWFGTSSPFLFILWSFPYSLLVLSTSIPAQMLRESNVRLSNAILALICSLITSSTWILFVAWYYGSGHLQVLLPLIMIFIFPIQFLWLVGSFIGIFTAFVVEERTHPARRPVSVNSRIASLLLVGIPFACMLAYFPAWLAYVGIGNYLTARPEIHLVRQGYLGPVVVVYNQPDGKPEKYEGRSRVYEIPSSGVLRTLFAEPDFSFRREFLYVDSGGQRTKIPFVDLCDATLPEDPIVVCEVVGDALKGRPDILHSNYIVGRPSQFSTNYDALLKLEATIWLRAGQ